MFIQIEDPDEIASEIDEIAGDFSFLLDQEIATDTALIITPAVKYRKKFNKLLS